MRLSRLVVALPLTLVVACSVDDNPEAIDSNATTVTAPETTEPDDSTGATVVDTAEGTAVPGATDATAADTTDEAVDDTTDETPPATTPDADVDPIAWEPLPFLDDVEIGVLEVPIDYDDPSKGSFELYVARHLATDPEERIGSLLVNPGGPGFGGSDFAVYAEQVYSPDLLEHFDIIGWDPRGTGLSEPAIDCIDDYDRYFAARDITPDDEAEKEQLVDLAEEFQTSCAEKNEDVIRYVGTNNSARDMNAIRQALGEAEISYFGFSYGSELGATWATLFPDTVRAAVLDGAADPNAGFVDGRLQQARGFEASLSRFLAECSDDRDCGFHNDGNAEAAFDALMLQLDEDPVPSDPGRPDVNRAVALTAVAEALYSEARWEQLAQALADAQDGVGSGLLALYDQYYVHGPEGSSNALEAFQTIRCMDIEERPTVEEEDATAPLFREAAPRFSPGTAGSYFCSFYPPSIDPRVEITGAGAGPLLVVGTTGDAATPLASTERMAETLDDAVLLVVEADQHTGYGVNDCSYEVIDGYLIDLEVPDDGFRCE